MRRFAENGYEIVAGEHEIFFANRRTWGLGCVMVALGIVVLALILLTVTGSRASSTLPTALFEWGFPAAAAALALTTWRLGRTYRRRRSQPAEEIPNLLLLDLRSDALRTRMGEVLARTGELKARVLIDVWTRGAMRVVVLHWPGGRRTIYRSYRRGRALAVRDFLQEQGLDAA